MKKVLFLFFTFSLGSSLVAQDRAANDSHTTARAVGSFDGINVSSGIDLIIVQGSEETVNISAFTSESRSNIETEVVSGILNIHVKAPIRLVSDSNNKRPRVYVTLKELKLLEGSAGSSTAIVGSLQTSSLQISLIAGSEFKGRIVAGSLSLTCSSGSVAHLGGKVETARFDVISGAVVYGFELSCKKCDAGASSSGVIELGDVTELSANATSGGGIYYKGATTMKKFFTGSGGRIKSNG